MADRLRVSADYDRFRAKANVFHSWVINYITYADDTVNVPPGIDPFFTARVLRFVNTPLATLSGFEWGGIRPVPAAHAVCPHVVRHRPRPGDRPAAGLDPAAGHEPGRAVHDPDRGRRWGVEFGPRIVNTQDELGTIRGNAEHPAGRADRRFHRLESPQLLERARRTSASSAASRTSSTRPTSNTSTCGLLAREASPTARVLEPGITPYAGINWVF